MSTLDHNEPEDKKILGSHGPSEIEASAGYEQTDVKVTGIIVFLVSLAILVAVCGIVTYGMGKLINARMNKEDGPNSKWTKTAEIRQLGNLPSSPEMQNKIAEITRTFPTPRVQTDDGNQDVADLHQREDLLLDNYTWVDQSQGKVRIPIERAMQIIAQKGLPVAPSVQQAPLLADESKPAVTAPITNGFARTGYEQDQAATQKAEAKQQHE
jgi:Na+-transporting methylmalonyl-CoA/oxaloacetate decarboxylase gamma subunit